MRERCRNWIRTPSLRGQLIWLSVSSVLVTLLISLLILVLLISNVMGPFVNREAEFAMQTVSQQPLHKDAAAGGHPAARL